MKILKSQTSKEIIEREIANMLIITDAYLFHEVPKENYDYMLMNCRSIIFSVGGSKAVDEADRVFNERVAGAKKEIDVEVKKHGGK